ncbi:MAG: DUF721 domain-containing protein, partial [Bifidobacterium sp.]|nr:DUF721 domain-containing protein [Bifidobacterium sp.]
ATPSRGRRHKYMDVPIVVSLKLDQRRLAAEEYERITRRAGILAERQAASEEAREAARENFGKPGREEHSLGSMLETLADRGGWKPRMQFASLFGDWASIVGTDVARHSRVVSYRAGTLTISCDSPGWTMNLRSMLPQLTETIGRKMDRLPIDEIRIVGPQAHGAGTSRRMYVQRQVDEVDRMRRQERGWRGRRH